MSGKQTIRQDIEHVRQNNPDTIASYGEFTDNSTSWGNANHGSIILEERKSFIIDDGIFNEEKFSKAFCKKKVVGDQHYKCDNNELGKYNFGLTDGVTLLGNNAEMIHKFGPNDYRKTSFNVTECMKNNDYIENYDKATPSEVKLFNDYQKMNNNEYDDETDRGTILIINDLDRRNKFTDFKELSYFMQGLYNDNCHKTSEWKLFNWINPEKCNDNCDVHISPNDLMFNCKPVLDKIIYVYKIDDENMFTDKKLNKGEIYKFPMKACFFEKEHIKKEYELFGKTNDQIRVGFQVRRGGRLLSGIEPKLWNLPTGMNHCKGFRVFVDLPINIECDRDWCVSTFKKITDDTWKHFGHKLKELIQGNFKDLVKLEEKDRKKKQKEFQDLYQAKLNNINNFDTLNEYNEELTETDNLMVQIFNDDDDKRLNKKNTNSYKAINNYINGLKSKINSFTPEPVEPVEPEPVEPEPVEPEPVEPEPEPVEPEPEPEPEPVEPEPEPEPVEPEPVEPEPVEPELVEPEPVEPEPVEPEPVEPEPGSNYKVICKFSIDKFKGFVNSKESRVLENDKKLKKIIKLMNEY